MRAVRTDASWTNSAFMLVSLVMLALCALVLLLLWNYQCFIVNHILYAMTQSTVLSMCCLIWMSRGFLHIDQPEAVRLNKADLKTVPKGNLTAKKKKRSVALVDIQ